MIKARGGASMSKIVSGIYGIRNTKNEKLYIGSSINREIKYG
jgi:hypothetical protein